MSTCSVFLLCVTPDAIYIWGQLVSATSPRVPSSSAPSVRVSVFVSVLVSVFVSVFVPVVVPVLVSVFVVVLVFVWVGALAGADYTYIKTHQE